MFSTKFSIVALVFFFEVFRASAAGVPSPEVKPVYTFIRNIERVFISRPNEYFILEKKSDDRLEVLDVLGESADDISLITDVPLGQEMYLVKIYQAPQHTFESSHTRFDLHIHGASSIEGGGWHIQSGKLHYDGFNRVIE